MPEISEPRSAPSQMRDVVRSDSHSTGAVSDPVSTTKPHVVCSLGLPVNRDANVDMEETEILPGETKLPDEEDFQTGDPDKEGFPADECDRMGKTRSERPQKAQIEVQVQRQELHAQDQG